MGESNYQKSWQEHYGKYPYAETDKRGDLSPEEFAEELTGVFKDIGFMEMVKVEDISVLASSVSSGKKDWEFLKKLDQTLDDIVDFHRPKVFLTDFALTPEKKSVVQNSPNEYKNLDFNVVASDAYHLPFKDDTFKILYERLGALYHAADQDITQKTGDTNTREMLREYKRVLTPGGKIIIDWINSRIPISTAENITNATKGDIESFFAGLGFDTEFFGKKEGFVILTKTEPKKI